MRDMAYRGASLIRKRTPLGPYRRPMPRVLGESLGAGRFLMGEVTLYRGSSLMRNSVDAKQAFLREIFSWI